MKELEKVLKALANKRRLAILKYLQKTGEASVTEIAKEIKLSFKSTSRHLGILTAADILGKEQRSLSVFYKIHSNLPQPVRQVLSLL